jgi:filamentous hemagglutinin family protein
MMKEFRKFSNKYYLRQIIACYLVSCLVFNIPAVFAVNPADLASSASGSLIGGVGGQTWGNNSVLKTDNGAVLRWNNFNTTTLQSITFQQYKSGSLNSNSAVLNKIISGNPTTFYGSLTANGRVFIVNPAGVLFGAGSSVNVSQLIASGLDMSESDFHNYAVHGGDLIFSQPSSCYSGKVENRGTINGSQAVYLVGKDVINSSTGIINCPGGLIVLTAADNVTFAPAGGNIKVIDSSHWSDRDIDNSGQLNAANGKIILAAGDIYTKAISNLGDLAAYSHGDITVDGAITATGNAELSAEDDITVNAAVSAGDDLTLYADSDHQDGGDMLSADGASLYAGNDIQIRGNDIVLGGTVEAGRDLTITGRDCLPDPQVGWGNVWAKDTLTAGRDISIKVTGEQDVWIIDGYRWEGGWCGHWVEYGHWETNYYPGTITLDGDVTASTGNISLYNNTYTRNVTGSGVTLNAGNNINLLNSADPYENCSLLSGTHYLALVAGNTIFAANTSIGVTGSTLLIHQNPTIDTGEFSFFNQAGTNLSLISDSGDVRAETSDGLNAADQWASIGAKASGDITLSGNGTITLGDNGAGESASLHSTNGNISVDSGSSIFAQQNIIADTGDITAKAANRLQLDNGASAVGNLTLTADSDYFWGDNLTVTGPIYAGGTMSLEGANIFLHGMAQSQGDMTIYAHGLYTNGPKSAENPDDLVGGGDVYINNSLTSYNGSIIITAKEFDYVNGPDDYPDYHQYEFTSSDYDQMGTIHLEYSDGIPGTSEVYAKQDVILNNNTVVAGNVKIEAGDDIHIGGNDAAFDASDDPADTYAYKSIDGFGDLYLKAGSNGDGYGNIAIGGEVFAAGNLTMVAGGGTDIDGSLGWDESSIKIVGQVLSFADIYAKAGKDIRLDGLGPQGQTTLGALAFDRMTLLAYDDVEVYNNADLVTQTGSMNIRAGDPAISSAADTQNILVTGNVDSAGALDVFALDDVQLQRNVLSVDDMTLEAGNDIILNQSAGSTYAGQNLTLHADYDADTFGSVYAYSTLTSGNGNIEISASDNTINLYGSVIADIGDITLNNNTIAADGIALVAGNDMTLADGKTLNGLGDLTINAGNNITLGGPVDTQENLYLIAGQDIWAKSSLNAAFGNIIASSGNNITVDGTTNAMFAINMYAGNGIDLNGDAAAWDGDILLVAGGTEGVSTKALTAYYGNVIINAANGDTDVDGSTNADYSINMSAAGAITLNGDATAWAGTINLAADGSNGISTQSLNAYNGAINLYADGGSIYVNGTTNAGYSIDMEAYQDITLNNDATAGTGITLAAGDEVYANGNLTSYDGDIEISSSDYTTYLGGDVSAYDGSILLNNNTILNGSGDQTLSAGQYIYANGFVRKVHCGDLWLLAWGSDESGKSIDLRYSSDGLYDPAVSTFRGNIWLIGSDDIQISGDVTTFGPASCGWTPSPEFGWETGGVAVVSLNGKIYTEDGINNDTLNVNVTGNSDHFAGLGVYNPFEYLITDSETSRNYVAIAIVSPEDLKIGSNASLNAYGRYYDPADNFGIDDRAFINFLDYTTNIPVDGPSRDPGQAFDLAIYLASTTGSVDMSGSAQILSGQTGLYPKIALEQESQLTPIGTMVIDAYQNVTFDAAAGGQFANSLAAGQVGSRLEVCSRITEWLDDAVGRLPYASGGGPFPSGYTYVLRGAGAENPLIGDGAPAWVLISRLNPPPINAMQLLALNQRIPKIEGCPAVIAAATQELGISQENIQVAIADAVASATDIQPCDVCARLVNAASILKDEDGARMAALVEAINAVAPANVPFTPEVGTQIATAFEGHKNDGTAYASAVDYVDAFVQYVSILDKEMGSPVGNSVAFVLEKHGQALSSADNANVAAFVASRLEQVTR